VRVILDRAVPPGETIELSLYYHGVPRRGVTSGSDWRYAAYWSCDWMYCEQENPADAATYELRLRVPDSWRTLAPGRRIRSQPLPASKEREDTWRTTTPVPAYAMAWATGPIATVADRARAGLQHAALGLPKERLRELTSETSAILAFFEEKSGVPLPGHRYTNLIVPGSAAQEAGGLGLLGHNEVSADLRRPDASWVIAHEAAHQWWGLGVRLPSWQNLWLSEGLTVFMTAAWKERRYGRASYEAERTLATTRWQRARDAGWDTPLNYAGAYPDLSTRRAIQYSKGALFFFALRDALDDDVFWRGLRRYTRTHVGRVATSQDLQRAFEGASGRRLDALFATWHGDHGAP
jgi:aminopeptidase N